MLLDERDRDSFRYLWFTDKSMREIVEANHPSLLHQEPGESIPVVEDRMEKILGVHWNPHQDNFRFTLDINRPARFVATKKLTHQQQRR